MLTHQAKFLSLVKQGQIISSLKTYSDTLLFYYLGNLASMSNNGNLFEIGVGGSTYPLLELSEHTHRKFIVVDSDADRLYTFANQNIFTNATVEHHVISSTELSNTIVDNLAYCHIDGNKDYVITTNDLEYCIQHLAVNGLICQDDYGNNKWPTVTDAVQDMIHAGQLVMLIVGDSSCWLTRPEYYNYWMHIFATDVEFKALAPFLNVRQSTQRSKYPNYLFMQSAIDPEDQVNTDNDTMKYYNNLLKLNCPTYLQMPYKDQSRPGLHVTKIKVYLLNLEWDNIKGADWPHAPTTKEDIDSLPDWVKQEITTMHQISDVYATIDVVLDPLSATSLKEDVIL